MTIFIILSYAEAETIMKRLLSHQTKEKSKHLLKIFEYATRNRFTVFENLMFSPCFYVIVSQQHF